MWYKQAVLYAVDVELFRDSNADGIGDFQGLRQKIPYLKELGVNCLWLLPFFPSPNADNGYDVVEYMQVDHQYGTLQDFEEFIDAAHAAGIRVLIDLVIHHTSNQHPWFLAARRDKNSRYRNYYIWSDTPPQQTANQNVFAPIESGVWTYDERAQSYYHHIFYHFQPDLNVANPDVQTEVFKILDFWLAMGVDGFRVDAASHLLEDTGVPGTTVENPGLWFEQLHEYVASRNPDAVLLGETDVKPEEVAFYLGKGNRLQMLFNFLLNNSTFLSLARESAAPLRERLTSLPPLPKQGQWANFLRNLDELDLDQLSSTERSEVFASFGAEPDMQVYGRGVRRRLAPMLGGNQDKLCLAFSLLMALPGTPVIVYGDEIGMGEDLALPERVAVRTPMQWSDAEHAGFSEAHGSKLVRDLIAGGAFSYQRVNVGSQQAQAESLWNHLRQLIHMRTRSRTLAFGSWQVHQFADEAVFGIEYAHEQKRMLAVHNLSAREVRVQISAFARSYARVLWSSKGVKSEQQHLTLEPYGYCWIEQQDS